jgi:hypothetical protein
MQEYAMSQNQSALTLFKQIESAGSLVLRGYSSLQTAREAIHVAIRQAGYEVVFDPSSDPELVDYLSVAGTDGIEGAMTGAFVGMLVGLIFERPALGAAIGAGIGGGAGVYQGLERVEKGWRIRAIRSPDHTPLLTINSVQVP